MLGRAILGCVLLGSALCTGCSSDDSTDPKPSDGGGSGRALPGCVLPVVQGKCQRCHGTPLQHGAPVAFLSVDDFQAQYFETDSKWWQIAAAQVENDVMPYVVLNNPPDPIMPPVEPLTPGEKTTLLGWLSGGALPDGTGCH